MVGSVGIWSVSMGGIELVQWRRSIRPCSRTVNRWQSGPGREAARERLRAGRQAGEGSFADAVRSGGPRWAKRVDSAIPTGPLGVRGLVTDAPIATIGLGPLRAAPDGMPDPNLAPPTIAESRDPFAAVRVIDLLARIERGQPVRLADLAEPPRCDLSRLAVPGPGRDGGRDPAPGGLDGRLPEQLGDRDRRRTDGSDGDHRGLEPGRSVDRPTGATHGRLVYRAACRVQPPRPPSSGA